MTTFEVGTLIRRPSASRPDLMAMLSSCAPSVQLGMMTWSLDSGSQPSVLECEVLGSVVTPSMMTFFDRVGCSCQNIGFFSFTSEISTVSQLYGSMKATRRVLPEPGTLRCDGRVRPALIQLSRNFRLLPLFQEEVPPASSVPPPVSGMLVCPFA